MKEKPGILIALGKVKKKDEEPEEDSSLDTVKDFLSAVKEDDPELVLETLKTLIHDLA